MPADLGRAAHELLEIVLAAGVLGFYKNGFFVPVGPIVAAILVWALPRRAVEERRPGAV